MPDISQDPPREILIHASVHRPRTILGGDRELVILVGLIAAIFIFAMLTWWSITLGAVLWPAGVFILARLGREDILMRQVYLRHVKYRAFYPAKAALSSSGVPLPRTWR
jgi:type IV secretion system protein VirB3